MTASRWMRLPTEMRDNRGRPGTPRITGVALLAALALLSGLLEGRFPLPFPGLRLGIANIFTLTALVLFDWRAAASVAVLKIVLSFLLSGNVFALICSASGTLLSLPAAVGLFTRFRDDLSLPALSVASATAFNIGQVLAVAVSVGEPRILGYLPLLIGVGCLTGYAVGVLADKLSTRAGSFIHGREG